ncbi:pyrroloquinoline quinone biosynthesis protein B [Spirosomataceae bacterium TFI 002]|nr:pyrroloquinoline quinone biosynthesis protein B [Spirosomataceae bacterium TFI 002]
MLKYLFTLLSLGVFAQNNYQLHVLGTVQDAGSPHISCTKSCCSDLSLEAKSQRKVSCLAIENKQTGEYYIFDATPDFPAQIRMVNPHKLPSGIFLTHAHIGHYTGLMYLGREGLGADKIPVYTMPKMKHFLNTNGPWSQLVALQNIELKEMANKKSFKLEKDLIVTPFLVPHRDEYSETVGYQISVKGEKILFIPDINKWSVWEESIAEKIHDSDLAFVDATFFDQNEVKRDISEIPHPFVVESMKLFEKLSKKDKAKVHFIHLNHTNPLLDKESDAYKSVLKNGYKVAEFGQEINF